MKSSSELCHGRRQRGYSLGTKSVSPSWLKHGRSRKLHSSQILCAVLKVCLRSVLGWVPGIITSVLAGVLFWITSMTMHKFIMKHPQIMDICKLFTAFHDPPKLTNVGH